MVKCADCGLLSAQNRGSQELVEVDSRVRLPGKEGIDGIAVRQHELMPICYAGVDLQSELAGNTSPQAVQECVQRERPCKLMRKLVKGRTPEWHFEMMNTENMLQFQAEQRELDRQQAKDNREWQELQNRVSMAFQKSEGRESRRLTLLVAIIGFIATLLAASIGLLGLFLNSHNPAK